MVNGECRLQDAGCKTQNPRCRTQTGQAGQGQHSQPYERPAVQGRIWGAAHAPAGQRPLVPPPLGGNDGDVRAIFQAGSDRDGDDLGCIVGRGEHQVRATFLARQPVGRPAIHADEQVGTIVPTPHPQGQVGASEGNGDALPTGLAGVSPQLRELPVSLPLSFAGERGIGGSAGLAEGVSHACPPHAAQDKAGQQAQQTNLTSRQFHLGRTAPSSPCRLANLPIYQSTSQPTHQPTTH